MSEIQAIIMPKWGLAMVEGTVVEWLVELGSEISAGDEIVEIETAKINNVFESPVSGPFRKIVVNAGETVPVGALLAVCAPASVSDEDVDAYAQDFIDNFDWSAASSGGGPEPETVEVGGKRIRYLKQGEAEGTPIIFVHGFGGDYIGWMFNQEALSENATTYAIDLPGHGGSSKDVGAADIAMMAEAVTGFMGALSIDKAHLVGHSMGGAVATSVALNNADKVASLTLIAPAGLGEEINSDYIDNFISTNRAKKLKGVLETLVADPSLVSADMVEEVIKFKRLDGAVPALTALRDKMFVGGKQATVLRDRLGELSMPVQVIWGEEDKILPVAHAEGLPGSIAVHKIAAAGHLPYMEKSGEVNEKLKAFTS